MPLKFMGNHLSRFVWKTLCHSLGQAFGVVPLIFYGTSYCLILERDKFHDLSRGVLLVCADVYVEANIRGLVFSESYRTDLFRIFSWRIFSKRFLSFLLNVRRLNRNFVPVSLW